MRTAPPFDNPIVRELMALLPRPGSEFKTEDRVKWLEAARAVFDATFTSDGDSIVVEKRIAP